MAKRNTEELEEALRHLASGESEFAIDLEKSIADTVERARGKVRAEVTTVVTLSAREKADMQRVIEALLNRKIGVVFHIDPQVLGGFKVRVGDWKLDTTLVTRINNLTGLLIGDTHG